jgi:hypothetical protein
LAGCEVIAHAAAQEKRADHLLEIDKLYQEDTGWKLQPSMPTA